MQWTHLRVLRKRSETSESNHLIFAKPKLHPLSGPVTNVAVVAMLEE
jgi:hypothetical protein